MKVTYRYELCDVYGRVIHKSIYISPLCNRIVKCNYRTKLIARIEWHRMIDYVGPKVLYIKRIESETN